MRINEISETLEKEESHDLSLKKDLSYRVRKSKKTHEEKKEKEI